MRSGLSYSFSVGKHSSFWRWKWANIQITNEFCAGMVWIATFDRFSAGSHPLHQCTGNCTDKRNRTTFLRFYVFAIFQIPEKANRTVKIIIDGTKTTKYKHQK